MGSRQTGTWPFVLLVGLVLSLVVGGAVAVAAPSSDDGRPWWHDDDLQRVTGTVLSVDAEASAVTIDGLVTYDPVRAGIGTLTVEVGDLGSVRADDTIDIDVTRHDGRWTASDVTVLDPD